MDLMGPRGESRALRSALWHSDADSPGEVLGGEVRPDLTETATARPGPTRPSSLARPRTVQDSPSTTSQSAFLFCLREIETNHLTRSSFTDLRKVDDKSRKGTSHVA